MALRYLVFMASIGLATAAPAATADGPCAPSTGATRIAASARTVACPRVRSGLADAALYLALLGGMIVAGGQASRRKTRRYVFS